MRSEATRLIYAQAGYRISPRARVVVDAFNLFDAAASDIDYFYTSRLRGEPAGGIEDVHAHPALPRTVRVSLQLSF
ncbi:MAG: TonB-dependent receptor [Vicinamibacterales bacterium]|nr:TonB-dependent receptor [Vicinamibacterales bacterium]